MNSIPKPRDAADAIADDERSVSEVVGVALLIGIVVIGMATILFVGTSEIGDGREGVEVSQAEQALTEFDSAAGRVGTGSTSSQEVDLGLRVNRGTLDVEEDTGNISVRYYDPFDPINGTWLIEDNTSMGTVIYENGDTTVGYQGGGVWRSDGESSTMVSPPLISNPDRTLNLPIIKVRKGASVHSGVSVRQLHSTEQFPNATRDADAELTNKVDEGILEITIEGRYYEAWGRYFEEETNAEVVYPPNQDVVIIVFLGSRFNLGEEAGIIATSGPGEIHMEGSGAFLDSYNSSKGPYSETATSGGIVKSAGNIDMFGNSTIKGDAESNREILLDGGPLITGDACANEGVTIDGSSEVYGSTNCSANVPVLPPLDGLVQGRTAELRDTNDNDNTPYIKNDRLNFSKEDEIELEPGNYYLEQIQMEDGEKLILDAEEGNFTIAVENYVVLDEGHIEITGNSSDGDVRMYLASQQSSGNDISRKGPGKAPADHFYVDEDSKVSIYNDTSTRFQVLAPSYFTGGIRGSNAVDPQVTGVILAPTPGAGSSQFTVRNAELFGSVVTGNLTLSPRGEIHFDHGIEGEEIPFGEDSLIDYLYITENEIEVKD